MFHLIKIIDQNNDAKEKSNQIMYIFQLIMLCPEFYEHFSKNIKHKT